jgi:hypothetical protein
MMDKTSGFIPSFAHVRVLAQRFPSAFMNNMQNAMGCSYDAREEPPTVVTPAIATHGVDC